MFGKLEESNPWATSNFLMILFGALFRIAALIDLRKGRHGASTLERMRGMRTKSICTYIVLFTLALVEASGATAEELRDKTPPDLQCLAVGTIMSASQDPQARSFGVVMAIYYLGRLDGSGRGEDIGTKLKAEALLLTAQEVQRVQGSCRSLLSSRSKALADVSNSLRPKH